MSGFHAVADSSSGVGSRNASPKLSANAVNVRPAVLFARADSVYKSLDCDVWDAERDARNYLGSAPVVAHPPCRAWGQLRHFARPRPDEKALAPFAVDMVRKFGGVLEHPRKSSLWPVLGLPSPGKLDKFGGWTLPIFQSWFGHRAEKSTFLYIVGVRYADIPEMPIVLGRATHVISQSNAVGRISGVRLKAGDVGYRPEVTKAEREHTPLELACWLLDLAGRCHV